MSSQYHHSAEYGKSYKERAKAAEAAYPHASTSPKNQTPNLHVDPGDAPPRTPRLLFRGAGTELHPPCRRCRLHVVPVQRERGAHPRTLARTHQQEKHQQQLQQDQKHQQAEGAVLDESMPFAGSGTPLPERMATDDTDTCPLLPPLPEVCSARWQTVDYLPKECRRDWTAAFAESLQRFNAAPSTATLT